MLFTHAGLCFFYWASTVVVADYISFLLPMLELVDFYCQLVCQKETNKQPILSTTINEQCTILYIRMFYVVRCWLLLKVV